MAQITVRMRGTGKEKTEEKNDLRLQGHGREGNVAARFEPTADMAEVEACVKALL